MMHQEAALMIKLPSAGSGAKGHFCYISQTGRSLMKSVSWKLCLIAGVSCVMLFGNPKPAFSADENRGGGGPDERLQRLERRINELTERQDEMMRRLGASQGPHQPTMNQPGVSQGRPGQMPSLGPENMQSPMPMTGWRFPMEGRPPLQGGGVLRLVFLVWIVCNILVATWIFTDIRKRGEGAGILIALAIVAGIPAAIIYCLVRIGDRLPGPGRQPV